MIKRIDRRNSSKVRELFGVCALCLATGSFDPDHLGVIYRRSPRSVTMRCDKCGLQWTMTFAKIHQALKAAPNKDPFGVMADLAKAFEYADARKRNPPPLPLNTDGSLPAVLVKATRKTRRE